MSEISTISVVHEIEYFPFLRAFFCNDGVYDSLTESAKMSHAFRLWQLLARAQSEFMQCINKEHNVHVMDAIQAASRTLGRQPGYCYIKADPINAKTLSKINSFSLFVKEDFKRSQEIDQKDFEFFCQVEPDMIIKGLQAIEDDYKNSKTFKKQSK